MKPTPTKDRSNVANVIKSHVSGQRTQIMAAVNSPDFTPVALAEAIRGGSEALEKLGIKGSQLTHMLEAGDELVRELEELTVGLGVEVLLKMDGVQGLRGMDQLSKGQRATALLLLLLGASDAPLIIDHPEDDHGQQFSSTRVLFDGFESLKGSDRLLRALTTPTCQSWVTLNSSWYSRVTEDMVALRRVVIGSLDERSVRSLAENILEGGPAAFNARQHLYGF